MCFWENITLRLLHLIRPPVKDLLSPREALIEAVRCAYVRQIAVKHKRAILNDLMSLPFTLSICKRGCEICWCPQRV